jgi:hypothetical protein
VQLATFTGRLRTGSCALVSAAVVLLGAGVFAPSAVASKGSKCVGTPEAPGTLVGEYRGNVSIEGTCKVDAGPAVVRGDLTVGEGSTLLAAYGLNDETGEGPSNLTVYGDLRVLTGATLVMGCEPEYFPCLDDPNPAEPTLSGTGTVLGNLSALGALGVIVHHSIISGRVRQLGGGGGKTCEPSGPFVQFGSPVYSAYEDTIIRGGMAVRGVESCWLGLARLAIYGHLHVIDDQLADPNAIEILSNEIHGKLICEGDSQVWDSAEVEKGKLYPRIPEPNTVFGERKGQCVLASPETEGGEPGPGPF